MTLIEVDTGGLTDPGLVRSENQDQFFVGELSRGIRLRSVSLGIEPDSTLLGDPIGQLLMVADGMGGHKAGHEASGLAVRYFMTAILNRPQWNSLLAGGDHDHFYDDLRLMLSEAHQEIQRRSEASEALTGMGTTFTMAYVVWPKLVVIHAGDTRCYIFSRGRLSLLTRDHTVANEMMRTGQLNPNNPERSPWSNVLVNALGAGAEDVQGDLTSYPLEPGDVVLMCSDGLNKHVDDSVIEKVLATGVKMQSVCESLVQLAKQGGGSDNITVVAAKWTISRKNPAMSVSAIPPSNATKIIDAMPLKESPYDHFDGHSTNLSTTTNGEHSGDTDPLITESF
ncbi:MAG: PP2C family protein-serine/threonine phosphatase [Pirellula sp.]